MAYALRLVQILSTKLPEVHIVLSEAALRVLHEESNLRVSPSKLTAEALIGSSATNLFFYNHRDIGAQIASGSALFDGMVVVPCSMGTLAAIANGYSQNLIHRAADVTIKERRKLILVPRETPLSAIHLRNMLSLAEIGVSIVPAMPGFYHRPETLNDLVDMMVLKILDQMGIQNDLVKRWKDYRSDVIV